MSVIGGPRLSPGAMVGAYEIEALLGEGGFGVVYVARDAKGARFALKHLAGIVSISPKNVTAFFARFRREARISRSLVHPGIVEVYDHGVENGVPYMILRLLGGRDLEGYVREHGPLDPTGVTTLALETCEALAHAHENGVIHRDLKPANVFVEETAGGVTRAVLCDFGIAKTLDDEGESLTETGAMLGTALYMSPEQIVDASKVDARGDIWSLGMTLYAALAGRSAFEDATTWTELLVKLSTERVPSLHEIAPWVPASLVRVVHAALLRDPSRRFASMRAFHKALERTGLATGPLTLGPAKRGIPNIVTAVTLPESAEELDAGRTLGKYRLGARLGEGGMGEVFEATSGEDVLAVKVLKVPEDPIRRKRFAREIAAIERIESPYVTRLVDTGIDETTDTPYLVMERLFGEDLGHLVEARGPLREGPLVHLFLQACEGLNAAHAVGLVHRDLKPSNLFLASSPGGDELVMKVCDFGIVKRVATAADVALASTELTQQGGLLGSPAYMSPEQAKNADDVDARSDVYSLSLSLHQALSGERPWPGKKTTGELIVAVCTEDVPKLTSLAPWVTPGLASVVERGVRRDRDARYANVQELARALEPFAATSATLASLGPLTEDDRSPKAGATAAPSVAPSSIPTAPKPAPESAKSPRAWIAALAIAIPIVGLVAYAATGSSLAPTTAGPEAPTAPAPSVPREGSPDSATVMPEAAPSVAPSPSTSTSAVDAGKRGHVPSASPSASSSAPRADAGAKAPPDPTGRGFTATELRIAPSAPRP